MMFFFSLFTFTFFVLLGLLFGYVVMERGYNQSMENYLYFSAGSDEF